MGNCISKISKDSLLDPEEFMKDKTSFQKGKVRPGLDRLTWGTYTSIHSIKGPPKKKTLQTGVWWRDLFLKTDLKSLEVTQTVCVTPLSYNKAEAT